MKVIRRYKDLRRHWGWNWKRIWSNDDNIEKIKKNFNKKNN